MTELEKQQHEIATKLLRWYRANARDLPWRRTVDPYRILVSEIMLQQTQVSRVIDYYARFLRRFPSLRSLASASWREVLPLWRGLGYYQRGKNLLEAAKRMYQNEGGVPVDPDALRTYPGIGPYTANAVASFAGNKPIPALDVNIRRVLQRVYAVQGAGVDPRAVDLFRGKPRSGAKLNHALMDIGATLCRAREVKCELCPLQKVCRFAQSGQKIERISKSRSTMNVPVFDVGCACIHENGRYLVGKRPRAKGGKWEFPGGKREPGESIRDCLKREIQEELGIEISVRPPFHLEEFHDGEFLWRLHFCRCQVLRGKPKALEHDALQWSTPEELLELDFPEANRAAVLRLRDMRGARRSAS